MTETIIGFLLAVISLEAAIIAFMLRHYFLRIERTIQRIEKLEQHVFCTVDEA